MRITTFLSIIVAASACTHNPSAPAPASPLEPERAQTPSERPATAGDQVSGRSIEAARPGASVTAGPRVVATLDQALGEKLSKEGDRFTATVIAPKQGQSALPPGTKLVGRVLRMQPTMAGSQGFMTLVIDGIQQGNDVQYVDARVVGMELLDSHPGGRPVNATGAPSAEIIGSIIPQADLPPDVNVERDIAGRGAAISLGTGDALHQLDKGMRLAIEVRGPTFTAERQNVAGPHDVTEITMLYSRDSDSLLGREVELDGVPVESVIGDVVFWIGPSKAQRTLVVLDKSLDTPEQAIVVRAGDRVTLTGVIVKSPAPEEAPRLWKLVTAREAEGLRGHPFYIAAYKARVVSK